MNPVDISLSLSLCHYHQPHVHVVYEDRSFHWRFCDVSAVPGNDQDPQESARDRWS